MNDLGEIFDAFGSAPFLRRDAAERGFAPSHVDGRVLHRPFRGVRCTQQPTDMVSMARSYAIKLRPECAFTSVTAAVIRGWPVPNRLRTTIPVYVAGPKHAGRSREDGVVHIRVSDDWWRMEAIEGLRVASPELTMLALARILTDRELAVVGDAAVTASSWYPGLMARASTSPERLAEFAADVKGTRGAPRLARATARIRMGVESPPETLLRLLIVDAGFPEPEVQGAIDVDGERVATSDLVYREAKIAIEYEGEHHRGSEQWEYDIARVRRLQAAGWRVLRVTKRDLASGLAGFFADLRAALSARTA